MNRTVLSAIVASSLLLGSVYGAQSKTKSVQEINTIAVEKGQKDAVASQKKLIQEAIASLDFTQEALENLSKNEAKKAKENIEKALGKLEVILSAEDAPKLLPIESAVAVREYIGTNDDVKKAVDEVKVLLKKGKVQAARLLLNTLQSEIDVTVVSLPLVSYPDALKLAAKYLHDGKTNKAQGILQIALSTFDTTVDVIPLPLLKASDLIIASSDLSAQGEKEKALRYLKSARDELKIAETLGYVSRSDNSYEVLYDTIKAVKKEIEGKNRAEKLFDSLKAKLKDFKEKIFSQEPGK